MKRKRITVLWMPSVSSRSRTFGLPTGVIYIFVALLLVSWTLLGIGGYLGDGLYHDYLQVREKNSQLCQKERELEVLRQTMARIEKEEGALRDFLGLDKGRVDGSGLGQGGEPSPELSTISSRDVNVNNDIGLAAKPEHISDHQRALRLAANLHQLAATIRDQRQLWDSSPSIIPVKTTDYWFSSGFGWRRSPFTGLKEFHNGLDISSAKGTPVIAPADGTVIKRGYQKHLGKYLELDHGDELLTTYGHLSEFKVNRGQKVKRGDTIALMGNTGLSTGHHLHYMIKVDNKCVNPRHYILNLKASNLFGRPFPNGGGA